MVALEAEGRMRRTSEAKASGMLESEESVDA